MRGLGGFDFSAMFLDRNKFPPNACVKAASFRVHIVFNADGSDAGSFPVVDGPHDVERISISGVAIGDHGNTDGVHDVALDFQLFAGGDEAGIRNTLQ